MIVLPRMGGISAKSIRESGLPIGLDDFRAMIAHTMSAAATITNITEKMTLKFYPPPQDLRQLLSGQFTSSFSNQFSNQFISAFKSVLISDCMSVLQGILIFIKFLISPDHTALELLSGTPFVVSDADGKLIRKLLRASCMIKLTANLSCQEDRLLPVLCM